MRIQKSKNRNFYPQSQSFLGYRASYSAYTPCVAVSTDSGEVEIVLFGNIFLGEKAQHFIHEKT